MTVITCHARGVAADDEIRHDTGKLRDYLRGEQEGWTTAYPKWDANGEVMPVGGSVLLEVI